MTQGRIPNQEDSQIPFAHASQARGERRGVLAIRLGHAMAAFIAIAFLSVYIYRSWQYDFWGYSFFHKAIVVGQNCQYATSLSHSLAYPPSLIQASLKPVSLPHGPEFFVDDSDSQQFRHVLYQCFVEPILASQIEGVPYLHLGWVLADHAIIFINGVQYLEFDGDASPALALDKQKLREGLHIQVIASGKSRRRFGMAGLIPLALGLDYTVNSKIHGLPMLVQSVTKLYTLLPLLTLALALSLAWFLGLRSRLIVTTFFYFSLSIIFCCIQLFAEYLPGGVVRGGFLSRPFQITSWLAILLIGQELLHWRNRQSLALGIAMTAVMLVEVGVIASMEHPGVFIAPLWQTYRIVAASGGLVLLVVALRRRREATAAEGKIYGWFAALVSVFSLMLLLDFVVNATDTAIQIGHYMELLLPIFVSALLFFTLAQIEKRLKSEREQRVKIENELSLAARLQGILLPPKLTGEACGMHYEIESKPFGILGGDWIKIHAHDGRALFILGDVVGKGPSAALTHSGIAAAWESQIKLWRRGLVSSEELLAEVNRTMFDLFRGEMNTTFAACEIQGQQIRVAASGNHWLLLSPERSKAVGGQARTLLGVTESLDCRFQTVPLVEGDWLLTFTDGVIEGNRALKRFMDSIRGKVPELTGEGIRWRLAEAALGHVQPDDATSLVLRYKQATGKTSDAPVPVNSAV